MCVNKSVCYRGLYDSARGSPLPCESLLRCAHDCRRSTSLAQCGLACASPPLHQNTICSVAIIVTRARLSLIEPRPRRRATLGTKPAHRTEHLSGCTQAFLSSAIQLSPIPAAPTMASTTPPNEPSSSRRTRSKSPRSRPTTPLRPSSRSSLRDSAQRARGPYSPSTSPLDNLEPDFAELSDAMADLEANFMQLQLMHESLARFSESFAGFLYGLNMNAFCVDFPETPIPESFKRQQYSQDLSSSMALNRSQGPDGDVDATFLTTDTSFVDNPPSSKAATKFQTPAPASKKPRGGGGIPRGPRGGSIPVRGGGIPRGTRGGSGIARGSATGRGRGVR
ncbi:DASH complex subunit Dam1-domain-containing protein [Clohesyomyces aquaticus]|uniref:DASH complex subunit DAM1 n=1 Tax=Clohesyomyces aquaticus TaxID=1231657 RepID=A0A1Y1ZP43_9PLEO|nr:DASH complex subunit Dam1-domain-containing protein [Clohesyomyces aquaticus]